MTSSSDTFTPKQVARAIGVSEASLKRWCDRGLIPAVRTAGGHRRIALVGLLDFLKASGRELVRPEMLGMPATSGRGTRVLSGAAQRLESVLVSGDMTLCRQVLVDLFLAGHSLATICDQVVGPCFRQIGLGWECGELEVYQERRACEICARVLHEFEGMVPQPPATAPLAMGGTISGDNYDLATTMVALVLRQNHWQAMSLGSNLPYATLLTAIEQQRPKLFWISYSYIADEATFLEQHQTFFAAASQYTSIAIGGRALTESLRAQMSYHSFCDRLAHLETFANTLAGPMPPTGISEIGVTG